MLMSFFSILLQPIMHIADLFLEIFFMFEFMRCFTFFCSVLLIFGTENNIYQQMEGLRRKRLSRGKTATEHEISKLIHKYRNLPTKTGSRETFREHFLQEHAKVRAQSLFYNPTILNFQVTAKKSVARNLSKHVPPAFRNAVKIQLLK